MKRFTVILSDRLAEELQRRSEGLELSMSDLVRLTLNKTFGAGGVVNEKQA